MVIDSSYIEKLENMTADELWLERSKILKHGVGTDVDINTAHINLISDFIEKIKTVKNIKDD